jgi:hypothetical protein
MMRNTNKGAVRFRGWSEGFSEEESIPLPEVAVRVLGSEVAVRVAVRKKETMAAKVARAPGGDARGSTHAHANTHTHA